MPKYQSHYHYYYRTVVLCFVIFFVSHSTINYAAVQIREKTVENAQKHQQLYYLCKVWGFLYYYHPAFAKGMILWEDELRSSIDKILSSSDTSIGETSVRSLTTFLLQSLAVHHTSSLLQSYSWDKLKILPNTNFQWLRDSVFDARLQSELEKIRANSLPLQSVHYLNKNESKEPIIFSNPVLRNTVISKTESLMGLCYLWNAVNYLSPHKKLFSKNWDSLLVEYIPHFLRVTTNADYLRVIMKLRSELNDSHAVVSSPTMDLVVGKYGIPMKFILLGSDVVIQETYCCDSLNLKGWVVKEINGKAVDSLVNIFSPLVAASNSAARKREIARLLRFSFSQNVSLVVSNGSEKKQIHIDCSQRSTNSYPQQKSFYRLLKTPDTDSLAYVDLGLVQPNDVPALFQNIAGKSGVIFDLRKYPPYIVYDLMQYLVNPTPFGAMSLYQFGYPGYHGISFPLICGKKQEYFGKIVVLVNEYTQSRGEFTVQALRTIPGIKIVGSQTAGADGEVLSVLLPMNVTVQFTINAVFDTEMKSMQGIGILPDVEVRPTPEGIRAGRDEVLEKGVEVLKALINSEHTAPPQQTKPSKRK